MRYVLLRDAQGAQRDSVTLFQDEISTSFTVGCGNRFDLEFHFWLSEGNEPEVVLYNEQLTPPPPTLEERIEAAELVISILLEAP